jgi:hypothetical protein
MKARIASWVRVDALRVRAEAGGAHVMIERKGDPTAGAIFVKALKAGGFGDPRQARLFEPFIGEDGAASWRARFGSRWRGETDIDEILSRQANFDQDLWIVTVEDRCGHHFLDDVLEDGGI